MNINKLFPSRFVKADDLGGKRVVLTIERVKVDRVRNEDGEREVAVVFFKGAKKGLLLNKTNAMAIAAMYTPETDNWTGQRILLYGARVSAFGKTVDAVRVDEPPAAKPNGAGKPAQAEPEHVPDALNEEVPEDAELDLNAIAGM